MSDLDSRTSAEWLESEMESSAKIAQVFSCLIFLGMVCYLVFSNSTKLSFIQQASQEKRLIVCCYISTAVAAISCFLNIFQITEVDNLILPRREGTGYTVDLARPVEWILTCPMMQLTLVLMGGPRIPEYRRLLMPFLSATIVAWGTLSLYVPSPIHILCYICGLSLFVTMSYFNRAQIIEHSNGTEGLLKGESEFRKASLILIGTWVPFPTWYMLCPEGLNVITNILVIQMGWMILNVVSKGLLILYIQRSKDNYLARLKVNKVMKGVEAQEGGMKNPEEHTLNDATLGPCVTETMTFLGMADKADRLKKLLKRAKITSLDQMQALTPEDCKEKKLPGDLILALQKRHRIWKLEVADDAEEGIEKGEAFYDKQSPSPTQSMPAGFLPPPPPGNYGEFQLDTSNLNRMRQVHPTDPTITPAPESVADDLYGKLARIEDHLLGMSNMREKMDQGFQQVCVHVGKVTGECQQAIQSGLHSVSKSTEKSGMMVEEKIQIAFSNLEKKQHVLQENLAEQNSFTNKANDAKVTELTNEVRGILKSNRSDFSQELDRMIAPWFKKILDEAQHAKEAQNEVSNALGQDNVLGRAMQMIEKELKQFGDEHSRFAREVSESVEKHVQVAVGVLTNTLRGQMDDMEDMHKEIETKMTDHMDLVKHQTVKQNETLLERFERRLQRDMNEQKQSSQDTMGKLEYQLKKDINDQKQLTSTVIEQAAAAQFRSKECCEMVAELTDRVATANTLAVPASSSRSIASSRAPSKGPPGSPTMMQAPPPMLSQPSPSGSPLAQFASPRPQSAAGRRGSTVGQSRMAPSAGGGI